MSDKTKNAKDIDKEAKEASSLPQREDGSPALPHSIEAEQALLGAILYNNKSMDDLQGTLQESHFYVPFHSEVFAIMERLINKGFEASPITLREQMKKTEYAEEVDLFQHLTSMLENAQYNQDVEALAEVIHSTYLQRQLIAIGGDMQKTAHDAVDMESAQDSLEQASTELFTLAETGTSNNTVQTLHRPLQTVIENAEAAKARDGTVGVSSGLTDLDHLLGGFQNSDLIILAARPSMGKTAMALNLAYNASRATRGDGTNGASVGVFSLEMSADQLASRLLSGAAHVNSTSLIRGDLKDEEFGRLVAAANDLADLPLYIDDTPGLSITALRARARRMKRQYNIGLLVVDYLQLLQANVKGNDNRVQEISQISMGLKNVARELNIPVIALSQLSRAVEQRDNKRPMLSDLRESGSIEQDADIVMFLFREEYYLEKQMGLAEVFEGNEGEIDISGAEGKKLHEMRERLKNVKGKTEVLISKNRKGATGTIALQFTPETTTFSNYSPR